MMVLNLTDRLLDSILICPVYKYHRNYCMLVFIYQVSLGKVSSMERSFWKSADFTLLITIVL